MEAIKIFTALLTPIIAIITVTIGIVTVYIAVQQKNIAVQQKKLAADKLKLDLYEKRFKIYKTVNDYVLNLISYTAVAFEESMPKLDFTSWVNFNLETKETPFLFDKDITDYLGVIRDKAKLLINVCNMLKDTTTFRMYSPERNAKLDEYKLLTKWFQDEVYWIEKHFESYLGFKHLK